MPVTTLPPMFAVHLSDGVLSMTTCVLGFVLAGQLVALAVRGMRDEAIPRTGVLTAAFFVASQIHLPLGVASVHLLLNGILGVVLGRRAALPIAIGLALQALLFAHGGVTSLGVNVCVYTLPALAGGYGYRLARRTGVLERGPVRFGLIAVVAFAWLATVVVSGYLLWEKLAGRSATWAGIPGEWPYVIGPLVALACGIGWFARRYRATTTFALGVLLGTVTGLLTLGLLAAVLVYGGVRDWAALPWAVLLANLPVVAVEAVGTGVVVSYLERVRPDWLGDDRVIDTIADQAGSGNTSSNRTSH